MEWNVVCKLTSLKELKDYTYVFLINDKEAVLAEREKELVEIEEKIKQRQDYLDSLDKRKKKRETNEDPYYSAEKVDATGGYGDS